MTAVSMEKEGTKASDLAELDDWAAEKGLD